MVVLRGFRKSLQKASTLMWGASVNGSLSKNREAALAELGKIHEETRGFKRQAGIGTRNEEELEKSEDSESSSLDVEGQHKRIDRIVMVEGLKLVDFGLSALGHLNKMYAYSQLMDF